MFNLINKLEAKDYNQYY